MIATYEIEHEPHAIELLTAAAIQIERLDAYRTVLADTVPTVRDRFDQLREDSATVGERATSNSFRLLVRELGILPTEPDTHRPPRSGGR